MNQIVQADRIDRKQFLGDRNLTSYIVPETVTEIGDWAFARCRNLKWIAIPRGLKKIGREAFADCESLSAVYFYTEGNCGRKDAEETFTIAELPEKQRLEAGLAATAFKYFPKAQDMVDAMQGQAVYADDWLTAWDESCVRFLQRPEQEGFVPFLAGGEEDYADDDARLEAYCKDGRKIKAKVLCQRLLVERLYAEDGWGLENVLSG